MARAPKTKRQVRHSRSTRYATRTSDVSREVSRYVGTTLALTLRISRCQRSQCVTVYGITEAYRMCSGSQLAASTRTFGRSGPGPAGLPLAWPLCVSADRTLFPHVRRMSIAHGAKSPRALHRQLSSQVTLLLTLGRADVMQIIGSKSGMEHACGSYNVEASVAQVQSCEECGATAMATEVYTKAPHVGLP